MAPPRLPFDRGCNVTIAPVHRGGRALPGPLRGCSGLGFSLGCRFACDQFRSKANALIFWSAAAVDAFGQVECRAQVAQLAKRQGDLDHLSCARIELLDRHAIVKAVDRDIFTQMRAGLIDERDHGGVKFMFDGKHGAQAIARSAHVQWRCPASLSAVAIEQLKT